MSYALVVSKKTLFIKLQDVYPECWQLILGEPQLHPLICLKGDCHRSANCMEKLANRVKYIFDQFSEAELLILYFKYPGYTNFMCGEFWKDMREPRFSVVNPGSWIKFKEIGEIFEWHLPDSFFLGPTKLTQVSLPVIKE